jgi:hypothetical protein
VNAANMVRGDRHLPRLPLQPHLRAVDVRVQPATSGCLLISRVDGRLVSDGFLSVEVALRLLVAGEG